MALGHRHGRDRIFSKEAAMSKSLAAPALVSDSGDDYEMSNEFANTWLRAGDRLMGFLVGGGVLVAAWAVWSLI
jgi:hypothetical protein